MAYQFPAEIERFLQEKNFLMLATTRRDGSPQVTPVWFLYEDGLLLINTAGGRAKVANMHRDPRVGVAIQDLVQNYRYLQVSGRVVREEAGERGHQDIDRLSERYTGNARFQGDPNHQTNRISFWIEPTSHTSMGF